VIIENDTKCLWYDNKTQTTKEASNSLSMEVNKLKLGIAYANPSQDPAFNGLIDIDTSLSLICYPLIDHKTKSEKKVLGVIQIIQA
jgi:hypothetical protein